MSLVQTFIDCLFHKENSMPVKAYSAAEKKKFAEKAKAKGKGGFVPFGKKKEKKK